MSDVREFPRYPAKEIAGDFFSMLALMYFDLATEIGLKCGVDNCNQVARHMVPWPGRDPIAQCQRHYEWTLHVADALGLRALIGLGSRPLDVKRCNEEPEDATAARFAAMELT